MYQTGSGEKIALSSQYAIERDYWLNKLSGELVLSTFPYDNQRKKLKKPNLVVENFIFSEELSARLLKMSREDDYALHVILTTAYTVLLERFSANESIIFGTPIYRQEEEGEYINTVLALKTEIKPNQSFKDLLLQVRQTIIEAVEHQNYPLETLAYKLRVSNSNQDVFLFDTALLLENIQDKNYIDHLNLNTMLSLKSKNHLIKGIFEYNASVYEKATVKRIIKYYQKILKETVGNANILLDAIDLFSAAEKKQIILEFNQTDFAHPKNETIIGLFEKQVAKSPEQTAVIFAEQSVSYNELNRRANQLAKILSTKGVKKNQVVGLMIQRSIEMIVGMIAIMKAGGGYLPLDNTYPKERLRYMIRDSQMDLLLVSKEIKNVDHYNIDFLYIDDASLYQSNHVDFPADLSSNQLAYLIYTSGSTGNPKGVMVEHNSIVNTLLWRKNYYQFDEKDTILQIPSFAFDSSVEDIFTAVISGAKIVMIDQEKYFDLSELAQLIEKNKVTHFLIVPNYYQILLKTIPDSLKNLRLVTVAGESFTEEMVNEHFKKLSTVRLCNEYGPTENSVCTTLYEFRKNNIKILIGKPIDNVSCFILDKKRRVTPIGVPGELCISGRGLTRGYYRQPDLTEQKYVKNPFSLGKKMYLTGDLARWTETGDIEFLGRIDQQIKIRGFRVELGEIENRIIKHKNVKEAVVIASKHEKNEQCLIAYVVLDSSPEDNQIDSSRLKDYLSEILPDYMIPQYIEFLEKMPLLPNGKIDRNSLPQPEINQQVEYVAPGNAIEEKLVEVWAEVLEINQSQIGIDHNFFDLGGHSLKATTFASRVSKEFNVKIQITEIFEAPTIREIANIIRHKEESNFLEIQPVEEREYYPLSSAQKRLFILDQFRSIGIAYNTPQAMIIEGRIDIAKIENAFKKLVKRHESLRTSFEIVNGQPVQKIHQEIDFEIDYQISDAKNFKIKDQIREFVKPFDLSQVPLLRIRLVKLSGSIEKHLFLFDMPHIVTDGTSMSILVRELVELYQGKELDELRIQYKDFAVWQNEWLTAEKNKELEEYWFDQFSNEIPILDFPTDNPRPKVRSFAGDSVELIIDKDMTQNIRSYTQKTDTTLYMFLLAAFNVLLSKYSGQEDIIVGSPIAGRSNADVSNIIGIFINTLALRNYPKADKTFTEFLGEVKARALQAYENQDYQFENLIEKLDLIRDRSRNPLFDVMFILQNVDRSTIEMDNIKFTPCFLENKTTKFDLSLTASEINDQILCNFSYSTALFHDKTIERMSRHFLNILGEIGSNPEIQISELEILSQKEKQELLVEFNQTKAAYPLDKTIHQLFEEQAEKRSDHLAVIFKEEKLTYGELNNRSNQLARHLRKKGLGAENIVALMLGRSVDMVVGILAVLKAGGAYLPIDHNHPTDRIRYVLKDAQSSIIITNKERSDLSPDLEIVNLKRDQKEIEQEMVTNLDNLTQPEHLAYVIYTSGTTGRPKGIMMEHKNVDNLVKSLYADIFKYYGDFLRTALVSPFVFDASIKQIFGALLQGHTLCIISEEGRRDGMQLIKFYNKHQIDISDGTPAHLNLLLSSLEKEDQIKVKHFLIGGEALSYNLVKEFLNCFSDEKPKITNIYGPAECCVDSTSYLVSPDDLENKYNHTVPIGKPMVNKSIYILDRKGKLVPEKVCGEIYISGVGLARGYVNSQKLTKEKFVENPFQSGAKMYKTGDLGRWYNGNIEFIGRVDHQVKIRGFRIELTEIEAVLLDYPNVTQAAVVTKEDSAGMKYLTAYLVTDMELDFAKIKNYLMTKLPEYMIPNFYMLLDKIPLTQNGKIDRKLLPLPNKKIHAGVSYVAPQDEIAKKLVEIWAKILDVNKEEIGINHNFFDLGGHSLKVTQLVRKIYEEFNVELPMREVFDTPWIKDLTRYIKESDQTAREMDENLVLLRKGANANQHLFIIHAGNGEVYGYNEFSQCLNSEFNCWGIKADRLVNYTPHKLTIEDIARHYIAKIRKIQPKGPYYISGWCIGGTIAFEMINQLENTSDKIAFFAMINSNPPRKRIAEMSFSLETELAWINEVIPEFNKIVDFEKINSIHEFWLTLIEKLEKASIDFDIKDKIPDNIARITPNFDHADLRECIYYLNVIRSYSNARAVYVPHKKVQTKAYFFSANRSEVKNKEHWGLYCNTPMQFIEISGDHFSIFEQPELHEFAQRFDSYLMTKVEAKIL